MCEEKSVRAAHSKAYECVPIAYAEPSFRTPGQLKSPELPVPPDQYPTVRRLSPNLLRYAVGRPTLTRCPDLDRRKRTSMPSANTDILDRTSYLRELNL